jgi:membrane protein CcdC involved in cytochrome C biogenesis
MISVVFRVTLQGSYVMTKTMTVPVVPQKDDDVVVENQWFVVKNNRFLMERSQAYVVVVVEILREQNQTKLVLEDNGWVREDTLEPDDV